MPLQRHPQRQQREEGGGPECGDRQLLRRVQGREPWSNGYGRRLVIEWS